MDFLHNHVLKTVSSIQDIVQIITSLFECLKKENNDLISYIKELREEVNDLISNLREDISTIEKEVDNLKVEIDNIIQYEHGDGLVISGDIIPHSTPTENCKDIVLNLFWRHLNMNLGVDELTIFHCMGKKPINIVDNRKISL